MSQNKGAFPQGRALLVCAGDARARCRTRSPLCRRVQKSLVLIASDDDNWKLVALDTGSKDKVREWLAQQRRDVEAVEGQHETDTP